MRWVVWLPLAISVLNACREDATPTGPESTLAPADAAPEAALGTWTRKAPMHDPRSSFAAAAAPNAAGQWQVYVIGGEDEDLQTGYPGATYDVATNTWSTNAARSRGAVLNGIGKIGNRLYFTGGASCCDDVQILNTTWAFEPATNRLLQRANTPKASMAGVSGVIKGKLYVLPGWCSGESDDPGHCSVSHDVTELRELWRYDPSTNKWTTLKPPPHSHVYGGAGVIGDKLYVVGSWKKDAFLDVYDPATNTWRTRAPIPIPGERLFAAPLQSKLFVISWSHPTGSPVVLKASLYDPATNKWTPKAAPPGVAGPIVKVMVGGQPRLFMPGLASSYMYTP